MHRTELQSLDGKNVLVRSGDDQHNPPVAVWGTIRVMYDPGSTEPKVEIVVTFPDMFMDPAHERVLEVQPESIETLMATERNGTYEFVVDGPLNQPSPEPHRVNPGVIQERR